MFCRNCAREVPDQAEFCLGCGARPLAGNAFCNTCGTPTTPLSEICIKCGARLLPAVSPVTSMPAGLPAPVDPNVSTRSRVVMAVLAWFLGFIGVHRFYAGRIPSGVVLALLSVFGLVIYMGGTFLSAFWSNISKTVSLMVVQNAAQTDWSFVPMLVCLFIGGAMYGAAWIWALVDFAMILTGNFKDGSNRPVRKWVD